jgi:hypothetical protein
LHAGGFDGDPLEMCAVDEEKWDKRVHQRSHKNLSSMATLRRKFYTTPDVFPYNKSKALTAKIDDFYVAQVPNQRKDVALFFSITTCVFYFFVSLTAGNAPTNVLYVDEQPDLLALERENAFAIINPATVLDVLVDGELAK